MSWWAGLTVSAPREAVRWRPARNAWVPLAAWSRRQGAPVVLMPPEQSVDLRTYYAKHTQSVHDMTQTAVAY